MFVVRTPTGTIALTTDRRALAVRFAAAFGGTAGTILFGTFCPLG